MGPSLWFFFLVNLLNDPRLILCVVYTNCLKVAHSTTLSVSCSGISMSPRRSTTSWKTIAPAWYTPSIMHHFYSHIHFEIVLNDKYKYKRTSEHKTLNTGLDFKDTIKVTVWKKIERIFTELYKIGVKNFYFEFGINNCAFKNKNVDCYLFEFG